ncbi:MAG TPA: glycosyl hydrolase family 8 [Polyangiaceae bacterium]
MGKESFSWLWVTLASSAIAGCGAAPPNDDGELGETADELSGIYELRAVHSGKCADVASSSTSNGANIQQWTCNGHTNQRWLLRSLGSGVHQVISYNSSKCMEVNAASLTNGANVDQWTCQSANHHKWLLTSVASGIYTLTNVNSSKCLDVSGASTADGANLQQWTCSGNTNQQWKLVPITTGRKFGSHTFRYASGTILPQVLQPTLDSTTAKFYDRWKAAYVRQGCGGFYILTGGGTGTDVGDTVSEGHGYGMVITAIMAGHDPNARTIFDGMYNFYKKFHATSSSFLMDWTVDVGAGCTVPSGGHDTATDGDLDIAFALLLANRQWGSSGTVNYLAAAKSAISAVKSLEVNSTTHLTLLGDWAKGDSTFGTGTRPSDFMLDHFKAYGRATGDTAWTSSVNSTYNLVSFMQSTYASSTGLLPDFVVNTTSTAKPAPSNYLEDITDGQYAYNSCRIPWRIGTDFVTSGDTRARAALMKLNSWIKSKTSGNPSNIRDGYKLDGSTGSAQSGWSLAFEAPFGVSAMVDSSNQAWLNAIWSHTSSVSNQGYFEDSIKMISMLVMSNNWWAP